MPHFSEFDTAFRFPYIDSHIDISLSVQLCCGILFLTHTRSSDYLVLVFEYGCLYLIDSHLGGKITWIVFYLCYTGEFDSFYLTVAKCISMYWYLFIYLFLSLLGFFNTFLPFFPPACISVFVLSSLSPPLSSLSSRGHGSFTGLSLSSSTTPRAETISLSSFCISHSK